jgi:hypothetical protein
MRAETFPSEDTTTLYVRWEIVPEGGERARLRALGGTVYLVIEVNDYVDLDGKEHATAEVEVLIYPHPGPRNYGQAKFTRHESRRAFVELLQEGVTVDVANFVAEAAPGSVPVEGHVIRKSRRVQAQPA